MIILALFDGQRRFLNSMKKSEPAVYVQVVTSLAHIGWCYLFVFTFDYKIVGLGLAGFVTNLM